MMSNRSDDNWLEFTNAGASDYWEGYEEWLEATFNQEQYEADMERQFNEIMQQELEHAR